MNKKSLRIAGWALGLSMAVAGIGVIATGTAHLSHGSDLLRADALSTGTITFGSASGSLDVDDTSVSGKDSLENTWTVTTEGTTSFTPNSSYAQIGSSKKPASSITFTTTLPSEVAITSFSASFGGFSGTAGTITLKVGSTSVGTGSLSGTSDVNVSNSEEASGTVLTVTVTGIAKGVKAYSISYSYNEGGTELVINDFDGDWVKNYVLPGQEGTFGFSFVGGTPEYDQGSIAWSVTGANASKIVIDEDTGDFEADANVTSRLEITLNLEVLDNDANLYEASKSIYICPHALTDDALTDSSLKNTFTVDETISISASGASLKATFLDVGVIDVLKQENLYGGTLSYAIDGKAVPSDYQLLMKDNNKPLVVSYTFNGITVSASGYTITVNEKEIVKPSLTEGWNLVTSSSEALAAGQQVVIAASGYDFAISTTQNNNNRARAAISKGDAKLSQNPGEDVEIFTLVTGTKAGTFGLKTHDNKYIYAVSSSDNYLRSQDDLDDNGSFAITFTNAGVASITAQGSNTRNQLKYNNSNSLFSCYASGQSTVAVYRHSSPSLADYLQNWVSDYMHLQEIGLSDNTAGEDCKGASGYYLTAKAALATLEASHSGCIELLENNAAFADARQRYETWAAANGDASPYDGKADIQASAVVRFGTSPKTNIVLTVSIVAGVGALVAGSLFLFRKKKEN